MHKSIVVVVALAMVSFAFADATVGSARVVNNCPFEVTLWSVGATISEPSTIAAYSGTFSEPFVRDTQTGGKALKITRERDGLFNGKPQTVYAYTLDGARVFYDLSDVFGDPFAGNKVTVGSAAEGCGRIEWGNGVPPGGSQVKDCTSSADVTFTLCAA